MDRAVSPASAQVPHGQERGFDYGLQAQGTSKQELNHRSSSTKTMLYTLALGPPLRGSHLQGLDSGDSYAAIQPF